MDSVLSSRILGAVSGWEGYEVRSYTVLNQTEVCGCHINLATSPHASSSLSSPSLRFLPTPFPTLTLPYQNDLWLFFGVQSAIFVVIPACIMLWRVLLRRKEGISAGLVAPMGRVGDRRSPASALRFFLFQQTQLGYALDVLQVRESLGANLLKVLVKHPCCTFIH